MCIRDSLSSVLVLITGVYLTWYWYVAITQQDDPGALVEVVGRWQSRLVMLISDVGVVALSVGFAVLLLLVLVVSRRRVEATQQ